MSASAGYDFTKLPKHFFDISERKPLRSWCVVAGIVVFLFLVVASKHIYLAIATDKTYLCSFIVVLFVFTLIRSYLDIAYIDTEMKLSTVQVKEVFDLKNVPTFLKTSQNSLFRTHLKNVHRIFERDTQIDQSNLVTLMQSKLYSRIKLVDLLSGVLVTLGLLGTVIGLLISVGGIGTAVDGVGQGGSGLAQGVKQTLSGMGTAFYTTLLGAMLGGVVLRVLNGIVEDNASYLICHIAELTEIYILPAYRRVARRRDEVHGGRDMRYEDKEIYEITQRLESLKLEEIQ